MKGWRRTANGARLTAGGWRRTGGGWRPNRIAVGATPCVARQRTTISEPVEATVRRSLFAVRYHRLHPPTPATYLSLQLLENHSQPDLGNLDYQPGTLNHDTGATAPARHCRLADCRAGSSATVMALEGCTADDACRLRALGLCEGSTLGVVAHGHSMILDVRGTRLALGSSITRAVTVLPTVAVG